LQNNFLSLLQLIEIRTPLKLSSTYAIMRGELTNIVVVL